MLLLLLSHYSFGQFTDNFTDGDFTQNPSWSGNTDRFEIDAQNRLWLNAPAEANSSYLATASEAINDASWEFLARLEFNPSSSNYARVYLISSADDLLGSLNGYFVRLGGETEDRISLYVQTGTSTSQLIASADGLLNTDPVEVRIRVTRDAFGNWELLADVTGGTAFTSIGTAFDDTHAQGHYFGIRCYYTATRSDLFRFDDINVTGTGFVDDVAPVLNSVAVQTSTELLLTFSEPVSTATAENVANYTADNGLGSPSTAVREAGAPEQVRLTFATDFAQGLEYGLVVTAVEDLAGNAMAQTTLPFIYAIPVPAEYRDIVINEFMADENPSQGLPETEFVEVFNTTADKFIDLAGWKLCDNSTCGTVQSLMLGPGQYAVLVPTAGAELFPFTPNVTTVTSWAALNNTGDAIVLQDAAENTIDQLGYTTAWYADELKADGGWSIEQVNPFRNCTVQQNWRASDNANGGTPGFPNSILDATPDTLGPQVTGVVVIANDHLQLLLDEPIDAASVDVVNISITPQVGILVAAGVQPDLTSIDIFLSAPLDTAITYTLTISGLADCEGNTQNGTATLEVELAFDILLGDLVINEVLFNPFTGGRDYVELYNRSDRPVNLRGCILANFADTIVNSLRLITANNYAVPAGGYVCLAQDTLDVIGKYINHGIGNFIEMSSLPSYNNDAGNVLFLGPDSTLLERFDYTEDMHFALLDDVKGVSLERLDPERAVDDMGNWHSAAQTVGFGTPGLSNSQYNLTLGATGEVSTDPAIFSPDNDGYQDVLNIAYRFEGLDRVGTVRIFDSNGRLVRLLATNQTLGTEGVLTWDGTTDGLTKARIGAYILLFEVFGPDGNSETYKLTTVLGGRL
ncbi:MAG: lamin tail domain-containing protein [Flavobacteriales bacterium]|nr:lamin tail domain-containing protein [Flavobacteriales bacterium]